MTLGDSTPGWRTPSPARTGSACRPARACWRTPGRPRTSRPDTLAVVRHLRGRTPGVGGLTAGIALRRADRELTVYDRAPNLRGIQAGGGIHLWHNAMRVLTGLGELCEDPVDVVLNRLLGHAEHSCGVLVGRTAGDQVQELRLSP